MNWKHFLTDPGFMAKPQAWAQKKLEEDKKREGKVGFGQKLSKAGTTMTIGTIIGLIGFFVPFGIFLIILGALIWIGGLVDLFE